VHVGLRSRRKFRPQSSNTRVAEISKQAMGSELPVFLVGGSSRQAGSAVRKRMNALSAQADRIANAPRNESA
jgi:hypothetical protein